MRTKSRLGLWALLASLAIAGSAKAEEWALAGGNAAAIWDIDVSSIEVRQDVVKSWTRQTLAKPQRDATSHKPYVLELAQRSDDCAGRKFAIGTTVRRNQAGEVVGQTAAGTGWQDVVPGSISASVWKTACAAAHPPKEKPFLPSIAEGAWRSLGQSADRKYVLSVKSDEIVRLDDSHVGSIARSAYLQPEWIDGYAVRYMVALSIIDCANETSASAGVDFYASPSLRVKAVRVDPSQAKFEPTAPGSFLANSIKTMCSTAKPVKAAGAKGEEEPQFATGTAWGVSKGYLATAAHVIEGAQAIDVYRDGEKVGEAKVVVADFANDLAILSFTKHPAGKLKILPLANGPATLGRAVFTLGYPAPELLGQGVKMTSGQVNSTSGMQDDTRMLQISIPVQGGNSGGPVLGWDASVLGVVDSKLLKLDEEGHEPPQNVNYAVKASYLRPMLDDLPDLGDYEPVKVGTSQEQTVAAAREAVFMLLVARQDGGP